MPVKALNPLFVLPRYFPAIGGAELHTREIARRLSATRRVGVAHHVANTPGTIEEALGGAPGARFDDGDVAVHRLGFRGFAALALRALGRRHAQQRWLRPAHGMLYKRATFRTLARVAHDYDVVHAVYNGLTPMAELAADVAAHLRRPFIWTPLAHTAGDVGRAWRSARFERLYRRADALIAMTSYERDWLIQRGVSAERVHICPVSALIDETNTALSPSLDRTLGDHPVILFLGRLVEAKGFKQLVRAMAVVWRTHPATRLVLAGPIPDEADDWLRSQADCRIIAVGPVNEQRKAALLARCDLFCAPSTEESLGVVYLEARRFAKPVVAADIPVMRTVVEHGEDGLLVRPEPEPIGQALTELLSQPALARRMGDRGAEKVAQGYHWPELVERIEAIHQRAAG